MWNIFKKFKSEEKKTNKPKLIRAIWMISSPLSENHPPMGESLLPSVFYHPLRDVFPLITLGQVSVDHAEFKRTSSNPPKGQSRHRTPSFSIFGDWLTACAVLIPVSVFGTKICNFGSIKSVFGTCGFGMVWYSLGMSQIFCYSLQFESWFGVYPQFWFF